MTTVNWRSMRLALLLAATVCAVGGPARADNKPLARKYYTEGQRHYEVGNYERALEAFKEAYIHFESPAFLFNAAQCHRRLDRREEAARLLETYIRKVPDIADRAEIERTIADLRRPREAPPPVDPTPARSYRLADEEPEVVEKPSTPAYKTWWFWTVTGVIVAAGAAAVAVALTVPREPTIPPGAQAVTFP